jgi:hypothetical protein
LLYVALQTKIRLPPTQDFFEPMENQDPRIRGRDRREGYLQTERLMRKHAQGEYQK